MATKFNVNVVNEMLKKIRDAIDAGGGPGKLRIYNGTRPATGGAVTTLLVEFPLAFPCAPNPVAGVLTLSAVADSIGLADSVATWGRYVDSANTFVCDGSIGSDFTIDDPTIVTGKAARLSSATFTSSSL